jgi:integrase
MVSSPVVGKLALELFAGLRCSASARMKLEEIDWEHRGVTYLASKHKLRKRFYVSKLPENLFEWLKLPTDWDVSENYYDRLKRDVFIACKIKNPGDPSEKLHNVLRHSFPTYHLAAFNDPGLTATILTHQDQSLLHSTYRGKGVPNKEGLLYFQITPETVKLPFEQFITLCPPNSSST